MNKNITNSELAQKKKVIKKEIEKIEIPAMKALGKYLGYPDCCIYSFVKNFDKVNKKSKKFLGTGYIPCKICEKKSEEELLSIIKEKRTCPTQFPNKLNIVDISGVNNSKTLTLEDKILIKKWRILGEKFENILLQMIQIK